MPGRTPPHITLGMKPNEFGIYDLCLTADGNLYMPTAAEAVALHVRWRLMTFEGEWFLDINAGVSWLSEIMGHRFNPALAEALIKNEVLDTDGVTGINEFSLGYNRDRRDLMIRGMEVASEYEDQDIWISNLGVAA
jgi:hypothetical protein